jgi:hypothetical protein
MRRDDDSNDEDSESDSQESSSEAATNTILLSQLGEDDILCSGDSGDEVHPGNVRFRNLVNAAKVRFQIPFIYS